MPDLLHSLKEIESGASTVLGVAADHPSVETPAKALAKKVRELIVSLEADLAEAAAEPEQPPTPPKVHAEPAKADSQNVK